MCEIRYQNKGEAVGIYICHCRECQKQSSSAFGITVEVLSSDFSLTQGKPKYWTRPANSGQKVKCYFCPTCGSRIWHESEPVSKTLSIKGGTLDQSLNLSNAIHIWVKRKVPGIVIPNTSKKYPEEPKD